MKLRTQRIHYMGASNRDKDLFNTEKRNVFETSYIKSQSCYYKSSQSIPPTDNQQQIRAKHPFQGTNVEHSTLRWNSQHKSTATQSQWKLLQPIPKLDYTNKLNADVKQIAEDFKQKDINMYKLNELKHTFIKNNSKRKNLRGYFEKFTTNDQLGIQEMKNVVKTYGYDINDDQAKIMFRLAGSKEDSLTIDKFIELMAKENVYFKTLRINGTFGKAREHFQQKIHLVFRNKFPLLKEAFRIYQMRGQDIDFNKFQYVMKKLDINDLVVSKNQRNKVFEQFSTNEGVFNVQKLLSAIVEQQSIFQPGFPPKLSDYETNIKAYEQELYKKNKKAINYDFKRMSFLQYQKQLVKAQQVVEQLKKTGQQGIKYLFEKGNLKKDQLRSKAQQLLKKKGINLNKQQYDCFTSYLDYNANNIISDNEYQKILNEKQSQTQHRFERRTRAFPPKDNQNTHLSTFYDEEIANESLKRIKHDTFETEMRELFKAFDKDKDGYVSKTQFKKKINNYGSLQNWQVQNLANYFDSQGKGFLNFNDFASKYTKGQKQAQNITERTSKFKSQSEWINNKQSIIKQTNSFSYNIPSKYSAWPERLKRTDFSMIQPPNKAGVFLSEQNRFNVSEKHSLGQQSKMQKHRIYQNKLRKLGVWNETNDKKIQNSNLQYEQRAQANDYALRITKEMYEDNCHK